MHKINISVNLADNKELIKSIDEAISDAVKNKTRELFIRKAEEELDRVITYRLEQWSREKISNYGTNNLHKMIQEKIDTAVKNTIGNLSVSSSDIERRIDEKLAQMDDNIKEAIRYKIDGCRLDLRAGELLSSEVKNLVTMKNLLAAYGQGFSNNGQEDLDDGK